ncbi:MAG: CAP domain-containing protein [Bacteroidetes bacterium]|nr:CAP domain-containing protein [Bacteroidota bacterium]
MFFSSFHAFAQHPEDTLRTKNLDYQFLEYLIKRQTDSIRITNGLLPLMNDSILYLAAADHVEYLTAEKILDHYQRNKAKTETPQKRVRNYGAGNYIVGENLGIFHLHTSIFYTFAGEASEHIISTYIQAANHVITEWINDPGSLANMLCKKNILTGVSVMAEPYSNVIRVVQLLAQAPAEYRPTICAGFFPYSENEYRDIREKYDNKMIIKPHKKHAWNIREPLTQENVTLVKRKMENLSRVRIYLSGDNVNLYVSDEKTLNFLISDKKDGIAVEAVPVSHYDCSSDTGLYYAYPCKRNNRCIFNGKVFQPFFRDQIFPEDEQSAGRKRSQDITVDLGKLPRKYTGGDYEINALIIKNGELCDIIVPESYCSMLLEYIPDTLPYIDNTRKVKYIPQLERDTLKMKVYFKRGEVTGTHEDIKPIFQFLKRKNYIIAQADVEAYASIEGTKEGNRALFTKRAENFIRIFRDQQDSDIDMNVEMKENWDLFFEQIKTTEFAFLVKKDTADIRKYVNDPANMAKMETLLDRQRYAVVNLIAVPHLTEKNTAIFANKEYRRICDTLKVLLGSKTMYQKTIDRMIGQLENAQLFLYRRYLDDKLSWLTVQQLAIPEGEEFASMIFNNIMLRYMLPEDDRPSDNMWFDEMLTLKNTKNLPPEYYYNLAAAVANNPYDSYYEDKVSDKDIRNCFSIIQRSDIDPRLVDGIGLYYHFMNADKFYFEGNFNRAKSSLKFLSDYYTKYYSEDEHRIVETALHLLEFQQERMAMDLLEPFLLEEEPGHEILSLYLKLIYKDYSEVHASDHYYPLYDAAGILTDGEWCSLFGGDCGIGYQIFDFEPLWKMYCIKCGGVRR